MTALAHVEVGVVAVSRRPVTRWGVRGFTPSAVLDAAPALAPQTRLGPEGDVETWYAGAASVALHPGDTANHIVNLALAQPLVWVALVAGELRIAEVTADPHEGESLAGDPGLVVEAVAMPAGLRATLADFVARHHVERPFEKRRRDRADPAASGRRPPEPRG